MPVTRTATMVQALIFTTVLLHSLWTGFGPSAPLPQGVAIDSIAVIKHQRTMYVFQEGRMLKSYRVALGLQPVGPKSCEGDHRTPEGRYHIHAKNGKSHYHRNLGISYPNAKDRARARALGRPPGGDIKIHGLPNGKGKMGRAHLLADWTHGCLAVTNEEMDELFRKVPLGTPVHILP